jgi:hypothetical protein
MLLRRVESPQCETFSNEHYEKRTKLRSDPDENGSAPVTV